MSYTQIMVPTKKIDSNSRTSQDFFSTFSWTFCIKVLWLFLDFWRNSRTFQDFYGSCTNSNNKISFLQNKNIYPVVCINNSSSTLKAKINTFRNIYYILLYRSFTPENWSFILTFWLKGWKWLLYMILQPIQMVQGRCKSGFLAFFGTI